VGVVSCEICKAWDGFKCIEIKGLNGYLDFQGLYLCNEAVQKSRVRIRAGLNPPCDLWAKRASRG
jgi:hypothetical protein